MAAILTELLIERLSQLGEGVGCHQGRTVFVEGALPGERVQVEVVASGKVLRGTGLALLEKSPSRREPACPLAGRCGGCDWLHAEEGLQRAAREEIVLSALEHLGGFSRGELVRRPQVVSPRALGYRRRAVMRFFGKGLGFSGKRSHQGVQVSRCPAMVPYLSELAPGLSSHLGRFAKSLEQVTLLEESGRSAFAVFLEGKVKPSLLAACEEAVFRLGLAGAVAVPREGPVRLVGEPTLRAPSPLCPRVPLYLRPDLFAQANAEASLALVAGGVELLGAGESDRVLELYSGNGNFTFPIAGTARQVVAVESSSAAVELAQRSRREGGVENVRFVQGDAEQVCRGLWREGAQFDLLFLDPPRSGALGVGEWAKRLSVRRVIYAACNPASLARDAADLLAAGFRPVELQVIDMFPQTRHLEALLSMERAEV